MSNYLDQMVADKPGYVEDVRLQLKQHNIDLNNLPVPPIRPLRDMLVVQKLPYASKSGLILKEHDYDKSRQIQVVVLSAGPGIRPRKGNDLVGYNYELNITIPNDISRGDIVQVVERLLQKVELDGKVYWLVPANQCTFAIELN